MQHLKLIKLLINTLNNQGLLESINKVDLFYDEPKTFFYQTYLKPQKTLSHAPDINSLGGSGISFSSRYLALLKSMVEAIERKFVSEYQPSCLLFYKYEDIINKAINLSYFTETTQFQTKKIAWVKGVHLNKKQSTYVPAQLVYLHYQNKEEPYLGRLFSGSAAGFGNTTTLLRGIYEVVERDALMTTYLNKIPPKRININSIKNPIVKKIINNCRRYHLEPYLFKLNSNLDIPTFLCLMIDLTGRGPSFSAGAKSSLDINKAIVGALEESLLTRPSFRKDIAYIKEKKINPKKIKTLLNRAIYWYPIKMLSKINWLISQSSSRCSIPPFIIKPEEELNLVVDKLEKREFQVYYVDATPSFFKSIKGCVFKTIIPGMQEIYFNEQKRNINTARLEQVAKYFGSKHFIINSAPHFFL